MNRFPSFRKFLDGLSLAICVLPPATHAGTRLLPPPPPRHTYREDVKENSSWGQPPVKPYANDEDREIEAAAAERFSALEDEEGQPIQFGRSPASARKPSRSPAGLQVHGNAAPSEARPVTREADEHTSPGRSFPSTPRVAPAETARQAAQTQRYVADLADPVERRKGVQEVALIVGDLGFFPNTIFVSRDVPVRLFITGTSKQNLCLMMDTFNVRKQVSSAKIEEITFVPTEPGTYRFYCPINNGEGTLVVKELTTSTTAQNE